MAQFGGDKKKMYQAISDAQKWAFAPMLFQAVRVLRTSGVLDYLNKNDDGATEAQISEACSMSEYMVRILAEAGVEAEVLIQKGSNYFISKTGYAVLTDEMSRRNMDFTHDICYKGAFYLDESVKTESPVGLKELGSWDTVYEGLSQLTQQQKDSWFGFDHFYSDAAFPEVLPKIFESKPAKILDVGGNTGRFSLECTKFNNSVNMTILDHPGQLNVAKENAKKAGVEDRVDGIGLDLLDHTTPFPKGYDAVWMSQFLDCFPPNDIKNLLKRGAAALADGGSLFVMEPYIDRQEHEAARLSLVATSLYFTTIANGTSRMYHASEMIEYAKSAGLKVAEEWDSLGEFQTVIRFVKA
jgi:ubiquinone/menaquinone biosynthesis C-methylase UbiE